MWLVNVHSKCLEKFSADPTVRYAILSHTWGNEDEELSFQDMQALDECDDTRRKKLDLCCEQACKDEIAYIWIDTCCIDKTNSVELHEAINSMFRWYQKAAVCYAYLPDVEGGRLNKFLDSRWFTRGWTLQELLAPQKMIFFGSQWTPLGTRSSMWETIAQATGIPHYILTGIASLQTCSVAQRMSWASRRTTTRPEDMAYCLLGIFDVMITPIYGEGLERAFWRLQEEIMRKTSDDSILAWSLGSLEDEDQQLELRAVLTPVAYTPIPGNVLAASPAAFKRCGDIVQRPSQNVKTRIRSLGMVGGTMPISISLAETSTMLPNSPGHILYGYLSCGPSSEPSFRAAIPLALCNITKPGSETKPVFFRPHGLDAVFLPDPSHVIPSKTILIRNDRHGEVAPLEDKSYWMYLPPKPYPWSAKIEEVYPADCFDEETAMIKTPREHELLNDEALFLVRFSYTLKSKTGRFILALRFMRGSVTGAATPMPYLYFDNPSPPTPFSEIVKLWSSLSLTGTDMITPVEVPSLVLRVSVSIDAIFGHPLWVVDLKAISRFSCEARTYPRGWPNLQEQISLQAKCCEGLKHMRTGAQWARKRQSSLQHLSRVDRELEGLNFEMAALKAQAENISYKLDRRINHRAALQKAIDMDSSKPETTSAGQTEEDGSRSIESLCFSTVDPATERLLSIPLEDLVKQRERDGVLAHIMQSFPIMRKDEQLPWVPGMTFLMYAAATGDPALVKQMFRYDSDLKAQDSEGRTAKDWATCVGADWEILLKGLASNDDSEEESTEHGSTHSLKPPNSMPWFLGLSPGSPELPDLSHAFDNKPDPFWNLPYPPDDGDPLEWLSGIIDSSSLSSRAIIVKESKITAPTSRDIQLSSSRGRSSQPRPSPYPQLGDDPHDFASKVLATSPNMVAQNIRSRYLVAHPHSRRCERSCSCRRDRRSPDRRAARSPEPPVWRQPDSRRGPLRSQKSTSSMRLSRFADGRPPVETRGRSNKRYKETKRLEPWLQSDRRMKKRDLKRSKSWSSRLNRLIDTVMTL
ncbi:hypothetical protein QBC40DRAFT_197740 [Triangularia verruculosa]|uniref:Heterokaryon incompatibility domain-containing protein n=1 Tax=Triangularia verruculosa TaxID=2587418 RepID=A0AAN6XJC3_9PEZI|nr:hypothetical protein QBC40DRAFT_197740 [Triangularia verruculosa]